MKIDVDFHEAENMRVIANHFPRHGEPFSTLQFKYKDGNGVTLYFEKVADMILFAHDIHTAIGKIETPDEA